ncbi:hypothetical protein B0H10DRAFT_2225942 [Mycena sp. CBHHK59/15]|nr:hypothetical protein B0H10DRAFT_2225942 [Mycena sp. CBHHK59/15]
MPNDGTIIPTSDISVTYVNFNLLHRVVRLQCRDTFVLKDPHSEAESVISAKMVQLYIKHNYLMNDPEKDIDYNPHGYQKFAELMNDFDMHPTKWAVYVADEGWTSWQLEGVLPTLVDYLVRDADLDLPAVPPGFRLVENELYERATEALWKREQGRAKGITHHRNMKKNREPSANIASPDKRAALAAKSARMESEYRARIAASRASMAIPDNNGEGSSTGPGTSPSGAPMDQDNV